MSKLDGYIRVSDVHGRSGDSFISPSQQRERIGAWATVHNHEIAHWEEDLDQTGGKLSRPGLDRIMERIRSGETGGIAVAKLDRFSRAGVGDALALIEEIKEAGAVFGCIEPQIDTSDPVMGEFVLTLFLALARMERQRIKASWADAQARAHARGAHMGRVAPFGYRKRPDDGRLEPDPLTAPYATELFARHAAGRSPREIARWLNAESALVHLDRRWDDSKVKYVLRNEAYLGHLVRGDMRLENAHPPLVDILTWQAAQPAGATLRGRRTPPASLLSGLVRCASCRYVMGFQKSAWGGAFQCRRGNLGLCPAPTSIHAGPRNGIPGLPLGGEPRPSRRTHPAWWQELVHLHSEGLTDKEIAVRLGRPLATVKDVRVTRLRLSANSNPPCPEGLEQYVINEMWEHREQLLSKIEGQGFGLGTNLDELESAWRNAEHVYIETSSDLELMEEMGRDGWLSLVKTLAADRDAKKKEFADMVRQSGGHGDNTRRLREDFEHMDFDARRALLAKMIQAVFVRKSPVKGDHGDLRDRVWIVWADEDPVEIPRTGRRTDLGKPEYVPRPYVFPNGDDPDEAGEVGAEPEAVPDGGDVAQGRV